MERATAKLTDVKLHGEKTRLVTDEHSQIVIEQGTFSGEPFIQGNVLIKSIAE